MWTAVVPATTIGLIWLFALIVWEWRHHTTFENDLGERAPTWQRGWRAVFIVMGVATLARLVPTILLPVGAGYDIESFALVVDAWQNEAEIYAAVHNRHPYLPFYLYILRGVGWFVNTTGLPLVIGLKLPAVIADILLAGALVGIMRWRERSWRVAYRAGWLYALNPIPILVSAYHGQFDAIPALFMVMAAALWSYKGRWLISSLVLGVAVWSKTWPIFLWPVIFLRLNRWRERIIFTLCVFAIPTLGTLLYIWWFNIPAYNILSRALYHAGVPGFWGYSAFLGLVGQTWNSGFLGLLWPYRRYILILAAASALLWTHRQTTIDALLTLILTIFIVTPGMGIQWLLWVVPLAILVEDYRWLRLFSWAGLSFLLGQLYGIHMYNWAQIWFGNEWYIAMIRIYSIPAWLATFFWTADRYGWQPRLLHPEINALWHQIWLWKRS
ncbi:MAG TPA: hypothetical protein VLL52_06520 [Anaerolineae bacterium]|nr:hypothetical protein [Anaerolineae bacterium]